MRVAKRLGLALLAVLAAAIFVFAGCRKNISGKSTVVNFWGWGDPDEIQVFRELVAKFNKENPYDIHVEYKQRPSSGYVSSMEQTLSGSKAPDVFYVGDGDVKRWATLGFLKPLNDYVAKSEVIDLDNMWDSATTRYRYDVEKTTSSPTDPLYGLPKDIGPTVLYYNKEHFAKVGVEIVSKEYSEDLPENEKHGFYKDPASGEMTFNNKIPMTWEESVELSKLLTKSYNPNSPSDYGYFTEWWFSYGWSVGGDCLTYNETEEKWEFSLGDTTHRTGTDGQPMPSTREAFTEFVRLSMPTEIDVDGNGHYGYAITPNPETLDTVGKANYFTSGRVAMMVDGRWAVNNYRKNMKKGSWDCAPLPKAANGVEAGHSGSMALGMWSKTKVADAAFKFIEFIAGPEGQEAQAATGFNIPNQKDLAATDVFLQPGQDPANAEIFLKAAEIQRPGDWTYMPDGAWIDKWAPLLNGDVRNGRMTIPAFFAEVTDRTNEELAKYTKK